MQPVDDRLVRIWEESLERGLLARALTAADDKAFGRRVVSVAWEAGTGIQLGVTPAGLASTTKYPSAIDAAGATGTAGATDAAGATGTVGATGGAGATGTVGATGALHSTPTAPPPLPVCGQKRRYVCTQWVKLAPHTYAEATWWSKTSLQHRAQLMLRTAQWFHPNAVFSGDCVLVAFGLRARSYAGRPLKVCRAAPSRSPHATNATTNWCHVQALHTTDPLNTEKTSHFGVRHVRLERILCDAMTYLGLLDAIEVLFDAIKRKLVSLNGLHSYLHKHPHLRGSRNMRAALRLLCLEAEHAGEAKLSAVIQTCGYARPELQHAFYNPRYPNSPYLVDMCWSRVTSAISARSKQPQGVLLPWKQCVARQQQWSVLELDGIHAKRDIQLRTMSESELVQREVERMSALMAQGCSLIERTTYDVIYRPHELCAILDYLQVPRAYYAKCHRYKLMHRRRRKRMLAKSK